MSTTLDTRTPAKNAGDTSFFGHPKMLASLFSVEMWERFSFYGMQGILLYYMYFTADHGGLSIDKSLAAGLVGAYGGGVYLSTILGAWLADRLFGSERVLFGSAIMIMTGHIALALLPGIPGRRASAMWPVMIMIAEPNSTRSEPKSRSANHAPRIVER